MARARPSRPGSLAIVSRRDLVVEGFRAAGVHCGIKAEAPDLALIVSDRPAVVAGVFTRSSVVGAPVEVTRERVRLGRARGVVVNSGVSNVGMGARGLESARRMTEYAARAVGCDPEQMLVASTGVIGEPIPLAAVRRGVTDAAQALAPHGLASAARAIMTTDTVPKLAVRKVQLRDRSVTVAGIAKGSGMIEPRMATMLAFLLTDASVGSGFLRRTLRSAADASFNRITVDGETSTSDMALLLANGAAGNTTLRGPGSDGGDLFAAAVREVCTDLAQALVRDGEGATRLVTVHVRGAKSEEEADRAARRIANSLLVKTALYGGDPNWGRILQTVGAAGVAIDLEHIEIRLGGVAVYRRGQATGAAGRRQAAERLIATDVAIEVDLAVGRGATSLWTCDLGPDYVRINADYST